MSSYQPYPSYKDSSDEWLGAVPDHWEVKKLKYHAKIKNGQDQKEVLSDDGKYPIFGSGGEFGRASRYLYNKTSVLLGRKGTIDKPLYIVEPFWTVDTMYYTQIAQNTLSKFFFYSCLTIKFDFYQFGAAIPSMTQENLHNIFFATPSFEEQTAIANFLDIQTAKIDTLIAKQQRLIELLSEKRQTLISHTVTKGLNSNVPMKDSGVEWLGNVPEHWDSVSLKWIASIYAGGTPDKTNLSYWEEGTIPWIGSGEVNQFFITVPTTYITEEAYKNSSAKWIPKDSLVMALAGQGKTKGMVAQLGIDTTCNQSMAAIVASQKMHSRFLFWWLYSNYNQIRNLVGGDSRDGLNLEVIGVIPCPFTVLSEQIAIANFLDIQTTKIDTLITKAREAIELMKERRIALISAAVTGKIDVRGIV